MGPRSWVQGWRGATATWHSAAAGSNNDVVHVQWCGGGQTTQTTQPNPPPATPPAAPTRTGSATAREASGLIAHDPYWRQPATAARACSHRHCSPCTTPTGERGQREKTQRTRAEVEQADQVLCRPRRKQRAGVVDCQRVDAAPAGLGLGPVLGGAAAWRRRQQRLHGVRLWVELVVVPGL